MVSKVATGKSAIDSHDQKRWKGVRKRAWGRWVCEIRLPRSRQRIWLGSYATAEEAACAYDAASLCLRGRTASLNFPRSSIVPSLLSRDSSGASPAPLPPLTREAIQTIAAAAAANCRNPQAAAMADQGSCIHSAWNGSQMPDGVQPARMMRMSSSAGTEVQLPLVRPSEWASAMALQLRLRMKERSCAASMHGEESAQREMNGAAEVPQLTKGETSASGEEEEEDQCLFSILTEFEPVPSICSFHESSTC